MHCGSIHLVSSISGAHVSVYWAPTQPLPTPEIPQQASSSSQIPSMHQDASPNLRSIRYRACDVVAVIYGDDTRVAQLKDAICSVLLSNSGKRKRHTTRRSVLDPENINLHLLDEDGTDERGVTYKAHRRTRILVPSSDVICRVKSTHHVYSKKGDKLISIVLSEEEHHRVETLRDGDETSDSETEGIALKPTRAGRQRAIPEHLKGYIT